MQDLDGNPLPGYLVHVWGKNVDVVLTSGSDTWFNTVYGNEAAWERALDDEPEAIKVNVQLHDPYAQNHPPVSESIEVDLRGYCSFALGYVTFTKNH